MRRAGGRREGSCPCRAARSHRAARSRVRPALNSAVTEGPRSVRRNPLPGRRAEIDSAHGKDLRPHARLFTVRVGGLLFTRQHRPSPYGFRRTRRQFFPDRNYRTREMRCTLARSLLHGGVMKDSPTVMVPPAVGEITVPSGRQRRRGLHQVPWLPPSRAGGISHLFGDSLFSEKEPELPDSATGPRSSRPSLSSSPSAPEGHRRGEPVGKRGDRQAARLTVPCLDAELCGPHQPWRTDDHQSTGQRPFPWYLHPTSTP